MIIFTFLYFFIHSSFSASVGVEGIVELPVGCSKKAMVWVSLDKVDYKERLLLMHTEVPHQGSFRFYLRPGNYQIRGSDESGCEYLEAISVKNSVVKIRVKMAKK